MASPASENNFQVLVMGSPAPKNDFQVRVKLLYRRAFFLDRAAKPPAPGTKRWLLQMFLVVVHVCSIYETMERRSGVYDKSPCKFMWISFCSTCT
jgi:hypothetical protein